MTSSHSSATANEAAEGSHPPRPRVVLGVDPGTARLGYAVVRSERGTLSLVAGDVISTPAGVEMHLRLQQIYRELRAFGLWEMVLFAVAVFVSFVYLIGNGALDWGPVRRVRPVAGLPETMRSAERTAETTVRRVDVGRQEPAA